MAISSYLEKLSMMLIPTVEEKEKINTSLKLLQERINHYFNDVIEHFCFGSYTRDTYLPKIIDKHADIDYILVFNKLDTKDPQYLIKRIKSFLKEHYQPNEIIQTEPTGIIDNQGVKIELIPAYRDEKFFINYKIPLTTETLEWLPTIPNEINHALEQVNNEHNQLIIPLIRLLKYWNALHGYPYNSYLLEHEVIQYPYEEMEQLSDYFFFAVERLSFTQLSEANIQKVNNFKLFVRSIQVENDLETALYKLSSILPIV